MLHAYVFPGQGSQFPGMGKNLFDQHKEAAALFAEANDVLGFDISKVMFEGSAGELQQTKITQPAVFIHSVVAFKTLAASKPDMVAGHSLGEFSALVANDSLNFSDALKLVLVRARAMQAACEKNPSSMAAILGLDDQKVEDICAAIPEVVVPANYNCPGQIVISGSNEGVEIAMNQLKEAGARRALLLPVGGAFHSPLMQPAKEELSTAIERTRFKTPSCPVYQNIVAKAVKEPEEIKANLVRQLTGPVRWTQSIEAMIQNGADQFTECGPGKVLQGLIGKINREVKTDGLG